VQHRLGAARGHGQVRVLDRQLALRAAGHAPVGTQRSRKLS